VKARAAVQIGARTIELQRLAVPDDLGDDEALIAVEGTGMCGTDWEQYQGHLAARVPYPVIPGHETVGRIAALGPMARARWGLEAGARVAVESTRPCGACPACRSGRWLYCAERTIYGLTTATDRPALSGGFAEYLVLRSNSRVYPVPDHLSTEDAVFFNPLGAGMDWGVRLAGTEPGDTVVVVGPGQRGLACLLAVRDAGADQVVVVGRGRRPWRLELARALGASAVVDSDATPVVDAVLAATGGRAVDRVIDTTPTALGPVLAATELLRPEGTLVLAAHKTGEIPATLFTERLLAKALTVRGAYSVSPWAKTEAIRLLADQTYDLTELHSHTVDIAELDRALRTLGGETDGDRALHITVTAGHD
jgi:threonine dehydrogenase-like Zn-dependent dehydrogenase